MRRTLRTIGGLALLWTLAMATGGLEPRALAAPINNVFPFGSYQVTYFDVSSSFTKSQQGYGGPGQSGGDGDALVRLLNVGNYEAQPSGFLCVDIYVFDDDQEMQECCACPVSPDAVLTLSVINDLTSNPQFSSPLGVGVIKILTDDTPPASCLSGGNGVIGDPGSGAPSQANGLEAWLNHTESIASNNPAMNFRFVTSNSVAHFHQSPLDQGEISGLINVCQAIELHASGRGICKCGDGLLGAAAAPQAQSATGHGSGSGRLP